VHLLAAYPPKVALSHLVNSLKGGSSRQLRQDFAGRTNKAAKHGKFWSPSYFAGSCGGPPLSTVNDYITNQKQPDQARFPPCPEGQGFHPRSPMMRVVRAPDLLAQSHDGVTRCLPGRAISNTAVTNDDTIRNRWPTSWLHDK
jgi:hypothetical protein